MRSISIMQPVYLPWLGFFEQMARTDEFVFLDDAQYTKQDWRNRNQLLSRTGPVWITIPIHRQPLGTLICDVQINNSTPWKRKHLQSLTQLYAKSPFQAEALSLVTSAFDGDTTYLSRFTADLTIAVARHLGIKTPVSFASQMPEKQEGRLERLIDIAKRRDCDTLYLGKAAEAYIDRTILNEHGIDVVFQNYQHQEYKQLHAPFTPYMSVYDLIANTGDQALGIILSSPSPAGLET